jgi:hypothetical protein
MHKEYKRSFIPISHRPFVLGISFNNNHPELPLAATLLDPDQRKLILSETEKGVRFSLEGIQELKWIKNFVFKIVKK